MCDNPQQQLGETQNADVLGGQVVDVGPLRDVGLDGVIPCIKG